jgi:hypothetical protein
VVDSFSTDSTVEIAKANPRVRLLQRAFDSFAVQCNFGLKHVRTEWVLSLDADYVLTHDLTEELSTLNPQPSTAGFSARFIYCVYGRTLRASLYPQRTVLYRAGLAAYRDEGHGHRVEVRGGVVPLKGRILHDDRKPLARWLAAQVKYASREAEHIDTAAPDSLNRADRLRRRIVLAPAAVFLYTLLVKGLVFNGWPGWFYVLQRAYAELLLSLCLLERKFIDKPKPESACSGIPESLPPQPRAPSTVPD